MAIRIINGGNSATKIVPPYDVRIIESVEDHEQVSFVMDMKNGKPIYKRLRNDEEIIDQIANMYIHDEIADIKIDEKNRDILIYMRELGQDPLEIEEIPNHVPEVINV